VSSQKVHISLDDEMLRRVDELAAREHRSRSELIREAIRRYGASSPAETKAELAQAAAVRAIFAGEGDWRQGAEFTTLEEYRQWRESLWAGTPRVVPEGD
jgi:metal-responsive CopG/Arc/MetJ family transcriptional regulator